MQNVNLAIPDEIVYEMSLLPDKTRPVSEKIILRLAIGMLVSQEISLSKAAELVGQTFFEFMDTLNKLSIPVFTYTEDMLTDDFKFATGAGVNNGPSAGMYLSDPVVEKILLTHKKQLP